MEFTDEERKCTKKDCEGRIEFTTLQNLPVVACPDGPKATVFIQGQKNKENDPSQVTDKLNCPLIKRIKDATHSSI